ncbi:hypothetical protein D3C73_528740 [compost metagenome]
MAAVLIVCAETEEEANRLATSTDLFFLLLGRGMLLPSFPSVETAMNYPYTEADYAQIRGARHKRIVGTPQQVKEAILKLNEDYHADEIMVVSPIHEVDARIRSYRLLAEAFDLQGE